MMESCGVRAVMVRVHGHGASREGEERRRPMTRKNRNKPSPEMCQLCHPQLDERLETLNEQTLDSD